MVAYLFGVNRKAGKLILLQVVASNVLDFSFDRLSHASHKLGEARPKEVEAFSHLAILVPDGLAVLVKLAVV